MSFKILIVSCGLMFPFLTFSQQIDDKELIFKVINPKTIIEVLPKGNTLYINKPQRLEISGNKKISKVELSGGTIKKKDGYYIVIADQGREALLSVYEELPNGIIELALVKKYNVVSAPEPIVYIDGVKNDSVIDKFTIIAVGRLNAQIMGSNEKLKVVSFNMQMTGGSSMDTLYSTNNQLTLEMKNKINNAKQGSIAYFENIQCLMGDSTIQTLNPIRIYINDSTIHCVGM